MQLKLKGLANLISNRIAWSLYNCSDSGGRYLFLKGFIGSVKVTLATIYAPNVHQDRFLDKV